MNVSVEYPSGKHVMQGLDELNLKESETVVQENLHWKAYSNLPEGYLALTEEGILDPPSKPDYSLSWRYSGRVCSSLCHHLLFPSLA